MPAPTINISDRGRRVAELARMIERSGLSQRAAARTVAERLNSNPDTMVTNFRRWLAHEPREGAVDAAPDHILDLMREIAESTPARRAAHDALDKWLESPGSSRARTTFHAALKAAGLDDGFIAVPIRR